MRTTFGWLVVGLGLSLPVWAGNLNFLKNGPVSKFTGWRLENHAGDDPVRVGRRAPEHRGPIPRLRSGQRTVTGMRCRRTELEMKRFDYPAHGAWKIATAGRRTATGAGLAAVSPVQHRCGLAGETALSASQPGG